MNELEGMISKVMSNPDDMKKIMEMASSFMGGSGGASEESVTEENAPPPPSPLGEAGLGDLLKGVSSLPPEMMASAMKLMKGFGGKSNDKQALLIAMKPYLSEGRRNKLENAVQLARVLSVGLNLFGKDGGLFQ